MRREGSSIDWSELPSVTDAAEREGGMPEEKRVEKKSLKKGACHLLLIKGCTEADWKEGTHLLIGLAGKGTTPLLQATP